MESLLEVLSLVGGGFALAFGARLGWSAGIDADNLIVSGIDWLRDRLKRKGG